jgi:hypothetical protein
MLRNNRYFILHIPRKEISAKSLKFNINPSWPEGGENCITMTFVICSLRQV